ncbi:hypothetical protein [Roseburia sp. 499]|uniref:hypothetical protein n=1 Tax=Roseburia sp. 499 TaxID=1261634 RepID=UPI000952DBBF|nr:hypothetical protein [Roseburia sp. 499]WVK71427.1 hypothetical protein BIV20_07765 [Roseburia sp. 499]
MKRRCSIRLLVGTIIFTAAFFGCTGFFIGTLKKQNIYEKQIALLEEENIQLSQIEKKVQDVKESLNVVEPYEYILLEEKGYVAVYHTDRKTLYASTDILVSELPEELQKEIEEGKYISSEEQLYNFLENYSS